MYHFPSKRDHFWNRWITTEMFYMSNENGKMGACNYVNIWIYIYVSRYLPHVRWVRCWHVRNQHHWKRVSVWVWPRPANCWDVAGLDSTVNAIGAAPQGTRLWLLFALVMSREGTPLRSVAPAAEMALSSFLLVQCPTEIQIRSITS